jgi:hypothetical protein
VAEPFLGRVKFEYSFRRTVLQMAKTKAPKGLSRNRARAEERARRGEPTPGAMQLNRAGEYESRRQ